MTEFDINNFNISDFDLKSTTKLDNTVEVELTPKSTLLVDQGWFEWFNWSEGTQSKMIPYPDFRTKSKVNSIKICLEDDGGEITSLFEIHVGIFNENNTGEDRVFSGVIEAMFDFGNGNFIGGDPCYTQETPSKDGPLDLFIVTSKIKNSYDDIMSLIKDKTDILSI